VSGLPDDDPGWGGLGGIVLGILVPGLGARRAAAGRNALVGIRQVFLSFAFSLVGFGIVLSLIDTEVEDPPFSPAAGAVAVLVIGFGLVLLSWRMSKELPCDEAGMVGMYRTTFFLRTAFANAAPLFGFAAAFVSGSIVTYLAGLVPAAVGFARNAPTRGNLLREDERLRDRGCPHSLHRLLSQARLG
jgi:hypothetical protein